MVDRYISRSPLILAGEPMYEKTREAQFGEFRGFRWLQQGRR